MLKDEMSNCHVYDLHFKYEAVLRLLLFIFIIIIIIIIIMT